MEEGKIIVNVDAGAGKEVQVTWRKGKGVPPFGGDIIHVPSAHGWRLICNKLASCVAEKVGAVIFGASAKNLSDYFNFPLQAHFFHKSLDRNFCQNVALETLHLSKRKGEASNENG